MFKGNLKQLETLKGKKITILTKTRFLEFATNKCSKNRWTVSSFSCVFALKLNYFPPQTHLRLRSLRSLSLVAVPSVSSRGRCRITSSSLRARAIARGRGRALSGRPDSPTPPGLLEHEMDGVTHDLSHLNLFYIHFLSSYFIFRFYYLRNDQRKTRFLCSRFFRTQTKTHNILFKGFHFRPDLVTFWSTKKASFFPHTYIFCNNNNN